MPTIVAAALTLYSAFMIQTSLPHLPSRIPVRFNLAGEPNGWGPPHMLWVLMGFQVLVTGVMMSMSFWARRIPQSVHFGARRLSDFTPDQRDLVWSLLDQMAGWLGVVTSLFFVFLIREAIHAASSPSPQFRLGWVAALCVGAMVVVSIYYVRRINQVASSET